MNVPTAPDDRPDLSVVIVNWNTVGLLREALASVLGGLGALRAEVFVIDNGSTDGSADMVRREFPAAILIANPDNRGFAPANNQALALARGRHVLLFNSDAFALGDVLERTVEYLDAHPEVGAMGCRVLNPDRTVQLTCFRDPTLVNLTLMASGAHRLAWPKFLGRPQYRGWDRRDERDVDVVTGCYLAVRGEVLAQVGPLDDAFFLYGEETDWCLRIRRAGWAVRLAPVGEIVHHGSASAWRCNHRRDLMLTSGIVRWHRKHRGTLSAAAAYAVLFLFNATRAAFWSVRALFSRDARVKRRRDHFAGVVAGYGAAWPRLAEVRS